MGLYSILSKGLWEKVYSRTLGAVEDTFTISDLDGDKDQLWYLYCRLVAAVAGSRAFYLRLNGDTGTDYGYEGVYGTGTTKGASRSISVSFWYIGLTNAALALSVHRGIIYPKTGFVRTMSSQTAESIAGTTVGVIRKWGQSWNNTIDKVTSLVFSGSVANLYGPGSYIELWRKLA